MLLLIHVILYILYVITRYVMKLDWNWNNAQRPIYGSRYGKTFDAWVCHFTDYLAAKVRVLYLLILN